MATISIDKLPKPPSGYNGWPWTMSSKDDIPIFATDKKWPKISIVTPTLNQGQFIEKTIRSVLLQGHPNLEYIIIDGGSSDNTIEVIKKYEKWISYWESKTDNGQGHAINKGFERSSGVIITWLNSDDGYYPRALYHIGESIEDENGDIALVGNCNRIFDNEIQSVVNPFGLTKNEIANWDVTGFFYQPACFIMRSAWEKAGLLDENLYCAFDLDFWLRLTKFGSLKAINEILCWATIHPQAKTKSEKPLMQAETFIVQVRHGYESLAIDRIKKIIEEKNLLSSKVGRLTHNAIYRYCRPLIKKILG